VNPTASKLELLERCAPSGALGAVWVESTSDQRAGTGRHRFAQLVDERGVEAALAEIPADAPWLAQCEALAEHLAELPTGEHEVAYAYDVATDTARRLGPWLDRAYDVGPTEVSGTTDLLCPPGEGRERYLLVDYKGEEEVAPAASNLQLGFYALCIARVLGLDEIDVAIVYLRQGGGLRWDRATLDVFALEAVASRVRALVAAVESARQAFARGDALDYGTGLHCRRCPALTLCPAMVQLARALLAEPVTPERLAPLSDDDAGRAWVELKVLRELVDRGRAALDERAKLRGLPLPGGARLVPVEQMRHALLLDRAEPVLREKFGDQVDGVIERSLSAEAVGRLARQLAPGKGHKAAAEGLWAELDAAHAVRRSSFVQLRTKPARPDATTPTPDGEP